MGKLMERSDSHTDCKGDQPCIEMSPLTTPTSPLDLSIHSKRFPFNPRATIPVDLSIRPSSVFAQRATTSSTSDAPMILIQPKSEWHYRSLKDLANNHLPLLAGNGRQRTPIRVSVPEAYGLELYLATRIVTMKLYPHPSKVIVPSKTTVGSLPPTHDNDLRCLHFDENSSDFVELDERRIYSRVTPEEHRRREKDVRVHMFNLYQNQQITKERIESEELTRCKLSFGFYILENGQFIPISRLTFSDTIEEKKMTPRSRASLQPHVLSTSPVSNSKSSETDSNPDAMDYD